jgi:hypothetical protein
VAVTVTAAVAAVGFVTSATLAIFWPCGTVTPFGAAANTLCDE